MKWLSRDANGNEVEIGTGGGSSSGSGSGSGSGSSGSSGSSGIQVFKSKDFPSFTSSNYTTKCVKFEGHYTGRILMIAPDPDYILRNESNTYGSTGASETNGVNPYYQCGNNIYTPSNKITTSGVTTKGVKTTLLSDGGVHVEGTCTANGTIALTSLSWVAVQPNTGYPCESVKLHNITGTTADLKLCDSYYSNNEDYIFDLDATVARSDLYQNIALKITKDSVYNCTFYPQIILVGGSQEKYEKPFALMNLQTSGHGPISNVVLNSWTVGTYTNNFYGIAGSKGNRNGNTVIDYPIVHEGTNFIIIYGQNNSPNFEFVVYYTDEPDDDKTYLQNYKEQFRTNLDIGYGICGTITPTTLYYLTITVPSVLYPYIKGMWYNVGSNSNGKKLNSTDTYYAGGRWMDTAILYAKKEAFTNVTVSGSNTSFDVYTNYLSSTGSSYTYSCKLDLAGYDDSQ